MQYTSTCQGLFLARPNRFIAHVLIDGRETVCHVKNTGRCRELLITGVRVVLSKSDNPARKTEYDIISVYKGDNLINIDSQAPNQVFREWALAGGFLPNLSFLRPETVFGQSRLDFYFEAAGKKGYVEVKGVTLEEDGAALFPDAPTVRGQKHLQELAGLARQGYECFACFVLQMNAACSFAPNQRTDPAFSKALENAYEQGVHILARTCLVTEDTLRMGGPVPVIL